MGNGVQGSNSGEAPDVQAPRTRTEPMPFPPHGESTDEAERPSFDEAFRAGFDERFCSLFRYLNRLVGDPAVASDIAQDALVRLYERGAMPDDVRAWLVTVAHNRLRNHYRQTRRRQWLLRVRASALPLADPPPRPDAGVEAEGSRALVRAALARLPERERRMLLLRAEGYSYREIAGVLGLGETSVGAMLARAKAVFLRVIGEDPRACD
jgi:RNA polymerase sigma factor (sigma-70 family)